MQRSVYAELASIGDQRDFSRKVTAARLGIQLDFVTDALASLKGKIASIRSNCKRLKKEAEGKAKDCLGKRSKEGKHYAKRRATKCLHRAERFKENAARGMPALCFGSSKLFNAQHHLAANGFKDHAAWKKEWQRARNSEMFFLGSKSKINGNQYVRIVETTYGTFAVKVRLPNSCEAEHGKYASFEMKITYGLSEIRSALVAGKAITWRFKIEKDGIRAFFTIREMTPEMPLGPGAIGVDFNAGFLVAIEIDAAGNLLPKTQRRFPLGDTYTSRGKRATLLGNACRDLVAWAVASKKALAIEDLDFSKKKAQLKEAGAQPAHCRMISSMAVTKFKANLVGVAARAGIPVEVVNPVFTSFIGRINFERPLGLSAHTAAAGVIARRSQRNSETPPKGATLRVSSYLGPVTFPAPVRKRSKHVWSWFQAANRDYRREVEKAKCLRAQQATAACATATPEDEGDFIPGLEFLASSPLGGAEMSCL